MHLFWSSSGVCCDLHWGHGLPGKCSSAAGLGGAASLLSLGPDGRTILQLRAHQGEERPLREDPQTSRRILGPQQTFTPVVGLRCLPLTVRLLL